MTYDVLLLSLLLLLRYYCLLEMVLLLGRVLRVFD